MTEPAIHIPRERVLQFLEKQDWKSVPGQPSLLQLSMKSSLTPCPIGLFQRGGEQCFLIDFASSLKDSSPENLDEMYAGYLDLTEKERLALWVARSAGKAALVVCLAPEGISLLDAQAEIPMGRCRSFAEEDLESCLRPLIERDPLRRPRPDIEKLADDLVRWTHLWVGKLGPSLRWSRQDVERFIRQILLGFKSITGSPRASLLRNLARVGFLLTVEGEVISVRWNQPDAGSLMELLLYEAASLAPAGAGSLPAIERRVLLRHLQPILNDHAGLDRELFRLSAIKLEATTQVHTIGASHQEAEAWRLALLEPLKIEEELEVVDFYVYKPLVLNLAECGFSRVLEAVEKIVLYVVEENNRLEKAGGVQLDLLEADPEGLTDKRLSDPYNWLCRHALRLRVAQSYREMAAWLVALHILDLRHRKPFSSFSIMPLTAIPALFEVEESD